MTSEQARIRNAEILKSFRRMTEYAEQQKIRLVLIAGDLFDRERITKRTVEGVLDAVRSTPQIDYLYVSGNHDDKTHAFVDQDVPQNFKSFTDQWSTFVYTHASQQKRYEEAQAKRTKFQTEHPGFKNGLSEEQKKQEKLPAVDALIEAEKVEKEKLEKLAENLQTARGERAKLLQVVEQIPEMEDQIGRLTEQRKEAESSCAVLDKTLELMETAKNNLSNQYVGGVERNFAAYMQELLGSDFGSTLVDHDLTIHVDEKGEAREIDYFSAGTIDSILLCMRLALVDALFKQEKPFILLDDPFVNLDDEHTKSALQMLQEIAQNRQVIYMVCNSSRC